MSEQEQRPEAGQGSGPGRRQENAAASVSAAGAAEPTEGVSAPAAAARLATRGERFAGALIDAVFQAALAVPLYFIIYFAAGWETLAGAGDDAGNATFASRLLLVVLSVLLFLLIHGYLLASRGQTVGKLLIKTRIVDRESEQLVPFGSLIAKRYAWLWACWLIPFYVGEVVFLVDVLLIFRASRACLHDDVAHTKVIKTV